jgi:tetratricopeptide (TPR) repeat protein
MRQGIYIAAGVLLAGGVCELAVAMATSQSRKAQAATAHREQLEQTILDLQGQIRRVEAREKSAAQRVGQLQDAIGLLAERRNQDRQVIKDLWILLEAGTRHAKEANTGDNRPAPTLKNKEGSTQPEKKVDAKRNIDALRKMVASSGGDLDAAVHRIVTAEAIDRTLQEHADRPAYWAAAASLAPDQATALEYLKEAARLHPDSPAVLSALVGAQIAAGQVDESTLAYANELKRLDPTNALGDCYAGRCQFESGDIAGALESLAQAGAKGRFSDDRIAMLMTRRDYFLDEGLTDAASLGLSAFTLPLEHLGMIRELGDQSIEQARALSAAGRTDDALEIAQDVAGIGRTVSSSGRFLVYDRVGIALQQAGLSEQRQIYEVLGDATQIQEIDSRLQAIQERSGTIDTMVRGFGSVMANMAEEDVAAYVDGTILNGEFATLQSIPAIAQALQQAPASAPTEAGQTIPPQR